MSVRFLATCFIHSPLGSDVIPPMHTQRVAISMPWCINTGKSLISLTL